MKRIDSMFQFDLCIWFIGFRAAVYFLPINQLIDSIFCLNLLTIVQIIEKASEIEPDSRIIESIKELPRSQNEKFLHFEENAIRRTIGESQFCLTQFELRFGISSLNLFIMEDFFSIVELANFKIGNKSMGKTATVIKIILNVESINWLKNPPSSIQSVEEE